MAGVRACGGWRASVDLSSGEHSLGARFFATHCPLRDDLIPFFRPGAGERYVYVVRQGAIALRDRQAGESISAVNDAMTQRPPGLAVQQLGAPRRRRLGDGRRPHDATYDVFAMAQLLQAVLAYSEDAGIDTVESLVRRQDASARFRGG
jgi:hypothetical protein